MNQKNKILLLESDALMRDLIKLGLGRLGCQVIVVSNISEALEAIKTQRPDIMILDIFFSHTNGFDFLKILKAESLLDSIKVVLISDLNFKELVMKALQDGISDFIVKPFDINDLVSRVQSLID